jgi:DDE family transposase
MATECRQDSFDFGTVDGRAVVGAFDGGVISSDAGALLLGATDKASAPVDRFAACFRDGRSLELIEHKLATLVGQRVIGIAPSRAGRSRSSAEANAG